MRTDTTKLTVAFHNFVNAPKKGNGAVKATLPHDYIGVMQRFSALHTQLQTAGVESAGSKNSNVAFRV